MSIETTPARNTIVDTIKHLRYSAEAARQANDYLAAGNKETDQISWLALQIYKGIASGAFTQMRNEGLGPIAHSILLEKGMSQKITPRQELYLMHMDEQYDL